jgi:hypothetical protein
MRGKLALLGVALCGAVGGCGLRDEGLATSALTTPDDAGGTPDPLPAVTGGSGGVAATGGASGTGGSPVSAGGSGGVAAGTGGQGGAPSPDAGNPTPTPPDARPPSGSGTIECGGVRCNADIEMCCAGAAGTTSCVRQNDNGCGAAASARRCDGPEDCDGERICCAQAAVVGNFRSACLKPSDCVDGGGAALCRGPADCFNPYRNCAVTDYSGSVVTTCQR